MKLLLFSLMDFVVNLHGLAASLCRPNNAASHCDVYRLFSEVLLMPWRVLVQPCHCLHEYRFQVSNVSQQNAK